MKRGFSFLIFFLGFGLLVQGQIERVKRGNFYRTKYPTEDYVFTSTLTQIYFFRDEEMTKNTSLLNQDGGIRAEVITTRKIMCLKDNVTFSDREYYTEISDVSSIEYINKYQEKKPIAIGDYAHFDRNIFHHDIRYKSFGFVLENLGDEVQYEVKEIVHDLKYLNKIFFNQHAPCDEFKVLIHQPDWLDLECREFNFDGYEITKKFIEKSPDKNSQQVIEYIAKSNSAFARSNFHLSAAKVYPHLVFIPKAYKNEQQQWVTVLKTKEDLYRWYKNLVNDLDYNDATLMQKAKEVTDTCSTNFAKVRAIYYWIQDNIKYIAFEDGVAGFRPEEASKVLSNKYGDCKGMANLTKGLLKALGFDARLAWIGTSDLPYDYSLPSLYVDNHMICVLKQNDQWYFLDGTEKNQNIGINAYRIRGKQVMVENGSEAMILTVPQGTIGADKVQRDYQLNLEDRQFSGVAKVRFSGDYKNEFLYCRTYMLKDRFVELNSQFIHLHEAGFKISDVICNDADQRNLGVNVTHFVEIASVLNDFDGEYYLSIKFDEDIIDIKRDTTLKGLDFKKNYQSTITAKITIPTNFKMKYLPQPVLIEHAEFTVNTQYLYSIGVITIKKDILIKSGKISKKSLLDFYAALDSLKKLSNDSIILLK
jgi:hypothetical protein